MRLTSKEEIPQPLHTPTGELIYELIGAAEVSGEAELHSLAQVVIPPGKTSPAHYHRVAEETYYVLRGEGRMEIEGKVFHLRPGQALLIEPGEVHRISNPGEEDFEFLAVCSPPWTPDDSYPAE